MAALAFTKSIAPPRISTRCHNASELAVCLALPVAVYLVYFQVRAQSYCPLCLISSALIGTLFAIHAYQWKFGRFATTAEPAKAQELGYACIIAFGGGGGLIAMLLFIDRVGIRRLDQGTEALQTEALLGQVLPKPPSSSPQWTQPPQAISRIKLNEWIDSETPYLGNSTGIPVVLFLDPNCPHCKNTFTSFINLSEEYKDRAVFYLLPRPLWDHSILQVEALELVKDSGKYFDLWRLQFENQKPKGLDIAALSALLEKLGLDTADFQKRLDSMAVGVTIRREEAQAAGINSTPTYFIDGSRVTNGENMARRIEQAAMSRSRVTKPTVPPSAPSPSLEKTSAANAQNAILNERVREAELPAHEAEKDLVKLLGAIAAGRSGDATTQATQTPPIARGDFIGRFKRAKYLVANQNPKEALSEYISCFEESENDKDFRGVRRSFLPGDIARLGINYPEAITALNILRQTAERRVIIDPKNINALLDFAALNQALDDDKKTLHYYDQLASNDPRRATLSNLLYSSLISAQRYNDAASGRPYQSLISTFDSQKTPPPAANPGTTSVASARARAVVDAATSVEVLAGSGDIVHAQELIAKMLSVDATPATLRLLRDHLTRAGRPDLILPAANPGK